MQILVLALLVCSLSQSEDAPQLTATEIMTRVAANQDREQAARNQFVYEQHVHRTMRRKDGKLLREEFWTYAMTPSPKGTQKKLLSVKGSYWNKHKYDSFEGEPIPQVGHFNINLDTDEMDTRDGLAKDLFPLTSEEQKQYEFERAGERLIQGRQAYQIKFRPLDHKDYGWTGEALIDEQEFQPLSFYTRLSRRLPFAVRTLLGTDVPGLGFNITYARVEKDIWFPSTYGNEFAVHALFLMNRTMTESTENANFKRTTVDSRVDFGDAPTPR